MALRLVGLIETKEQINNRTPMVLQFQVVPRSDALRSGSVQAFQLAPNAGNVDNEVKLLSQCINEAIVSFTRSIAERIEFAVDLDLQYATSYPTVYVHLLSVGYSFRVAIDLDARLAHVWYCVAQTSISMPLANS